MKIKKIKMRKFYLILFVTSFVLAACGMGSSNDSAEKDEDQNRYVTIVNETDQVINKVVIEADSGTEVAREENPKDKSFSLKIPKEYEEHTEFTILVQDRYDYVYEEEITFEEAYGRQEVVIDTKNKVKDGNLWDKIFNGD